MMMTFLINMFLDEETPKHSKWPWRRYLVSIITVIFVLLKYLTVAQSSLFSHRELKHRRRRRQQNVTFEMNSRVFTVFHVYSNSLKMSNVGEFLWSCLLGLKRESKNSSSLVYILHITCDRAFSRRSRRAVTATNCTKKAWCTCRVVVLLIIPIAFLRSSLPSPSSLLKLPNLNEGGERNISSFTESPPTVLRLRETRGGWERVSVDSMHAKT